MNPRTRRLRRLRRRARKRGEIALALLRSGYPRLKVAAESKTPLSQYLIRIEPQ